PLIVVEFHGGRMNHFRIEWLSFFVFDSIIDKKVSILFRRRLVLSYLCHHLGKENICRHADDKSDDEDHENQGNQDDFLFQVTGLQLEVLELLCLMLARLRLDSQPAPQINASPNRSSWKWIWD